MSEETVKIRCNIKGLEFDYEGPPSFLQDELFNLIEKLASFCAEHQEATSTDWKSAQGNGVDLASVPAELNHSTNTIATILGVRSGSDLVIAASAKLTLVDKKDRLSRKDISNEMKAATSFYKNTYSSNFSTYLNRLVKSDRLRLVAKQTYAISSEEKKELNAKLAE